MKPKDKKTKDFDTVKIFRKIKDKISMDIKRMDFEQYPHTSIKRN